ncbi:PepSY-associated TM helix domain-containing protein [Bordetella petrii]|uniref:PepSY-associated TM helix domain-containing protein n=1 Tax=Bordetella petrii TaxID=94624 RepID=UPI001E330A61|nr:PepSY domain-containing protein [Bordetella petrii]MCD0502200.1 PepSY domain-containing protein [Bordetella petrii]
MSTQTWSWIHKWSSLVCTVFMLLLCLTGLPLIFHEEIEHLSGVVEAPPMPEGTPNASLDRIAQAALERRPGEVIRYMFWEQDEHPDITYVSMASAIDAPPEENNAVIVDSRSAQVLDEPATNEGFMYVMLKLHTDMFAGLPGMLFLGAMGLLMVVAIVSGVVLYYPFMRRLKFGALRTQRSTRVKWLDWHNLLGIVAVVWLTVVGVTGSINTLNRVILGLWQMDQMAEMTAPYRGLPAVTQPAHLEESIRAARAAVPDMAVSLVAFPGTMFSSPHHYTFFLKGSTPVTARLLKPALVDATTGKLTDTRDMPWYVKTLFLSQPLHFGDYGGLPLKILWAILDLFAIVILGSGLYLWLRKPKAVAAAKAPADGRVEPANALHRANTNEAAQ